MEVTSLGYRTDLLVRRLAGSDVVDLGDHLVVRTAANPDFYWGNFVLVPSPLAPGDAARWLSVFGAEFPSARHVAVGIDGTEATVGDISEFLAAGLAVEVSTVLSASALREPSRPHGSADYGRADYGRADYGRATFRRLATRGDWQQVIGLRQAVAADEGRDSAEHRQYLARSVDEARHLAEAGHGASFGAFIDGRIWSSLGLVTDGAGLARFQNVETHPGRRRQGLATWLVHAAGRYGLQHHGAHTLVIVADPDGPAIGLYRALGFVDAEHQVELSRPLRI